MITLNDKVSGAFIGSITEVQLRCQVDELEKLTGFPAVMDNPGAIKI